MKYWRLISLDSTGRRKSEEIPEALAFFTEAFLSNPQTPGLEDAPIQRQLFDWFLGESPNGDATTRYHAELCLRCFISASIESACIQLEQKFGTNHGFTRHDLFPFVLHDVILKHRVYSSSYTTLATEILQTFNPDKSNLSTWTYRLVLQHRELKDFLLERGVYLVSDWAILNDTTPKQLQRILSEFYHRTDVDIQQSANLLSSYHAVYRSQRLASRKAGTRRQCPPPTVEQLRQIAQPLNLQAEDAMTRLQNLASRLRQHRIAARCKTPPTRSIDVPEIARAVNKQLADDSAETDTDDNWRSDFLQFYRQQFIDSLDTALRQVTQNRITYLQRKNPAAVSQFTTALHLFHCQGESMGSIAPLVGLQAQYQVTRLLKLKEFRASVQQQMLELLLSTIIDRAMVYSPQPLSILSQKVASALDEKIKEMIQSASDESSTAKKRSEKSLFAHQLCLYLDQLAR